MTGVPVIRPVRPDDLGDVVRMCADHAAYERAPFNPDGLGARLSRELFGPSPRVGCLVADMATSQDATTSGTGQLVGYCAFAPEFSFWSGEEYVHLDAIYVVPEARGAGLGSRLLRAAAAAARAGGATQMQWQTPDWNTDAQRLYERLGALGRAKLRYQWDLSGVETAPESGDDASARVAAPTLRHAARAAADALTAGWWTGDPGAFVATMTEDAAYDASIGERSVRRAQGRDDVLRLAERVMRLERTAEAPSPPPPDPADELVAGPVTVRRWAYTADGPDGAEHLVEGIDVLHIRDGLVAVKDAYRKTEQE